MFHFPRLPACSYEFTTRSKLFRLSGCPIRKSPDQSPLAAPRGLSQPATSFVDAYRLGIHHVLFSTSNQNFASRPRAVTSVPVSGISAISNEIAFASTIFFSCQRLLP